MLHGLGQKAPNQSDIQHVFLFFLVMWIRMWKITIPLHFSLVSIFSFEGVMIRFFFSSSMICIMFSLCSKHNRKVIWNQREKEEINWRAEERRFRGSTFCSFLHVSAFHDHALWNAPKTWEPLLCVIQFQARLLPSAHTDKTAWDGKSTWINIYHGRCCFRQVLFKGNLLGMHRCYGNNLLIEVFLQSFYSSVVNRLMLGSAWNSSALWVFVMSDKT